jgi:hypothetical protein
MTLGEGDVTVLLNEMANGDPRAAEKLLPLAYTELHRLASSYMRTIRPHPPGHRSHQRSLPSIERRKRAMEQP